MPGRQIHYGIGTPHNGPLQFFHFLGYRRVRRTVSDVSINLSTELATDDYRFEFRVFDIRRNNRAPCRDFFAYKFWITLLTCGHKRHLSCYLAFTRIVHLRKVFVATLEALSNPRGAQWRQTFARINPLRPGRVVSVVVFAVSQMNTAKRHFNIKATVRHSAAHLFA